MTQTPTNKFRASWTVLGIWESGQWQEAIEYYFGIAKRDSEAMELGRKFHSEFEAQTKETGQLPAVFGGLKLENPRCELKLHVEVSDWLELVGKIDCYSDPGIIDEYKTGSTSQPRKLRGLSQGTIYGLLAVGNDLPIRQVRLHHYNPITKDAFTDITWTTPKVLREGKEILLDLAWEMHSYLVRNNLYEELGKK